MLNKIPSMKPFCFILCLVALLSQAQEVKIDQIRSDFIRSNNSTQNAKNFLKLTQRGLQNDQDIFKAYYGAAVVMKASYCSIFSKLAAFKEGKKIVESAIKRNPDNLEMRMIRICIQSNVPKILGYSGQIESDKNKIKTWVSDLKDQKQKAFLQKFIKESGFYKETKT